MGGDERHHAPVELVDPVEAAVAAGDDGDLGPRHDPAPVAGLAAARRVTGNRWRITHR
jgi:hypothetical protein